MLFVVALLFSLAVSVDGASNFHKHTVTQHKQWWAVASASSGESPFTDDFEGYWSSVGAVNASGVRRVRAMLHEALPGLRVPRWEVADGYHQNEVHVYWEIVGDYAGHFNGKLGDGRPIHLRGMNRYFVNVKGVIYSGDSHYNWADVVAQFTLAPAQLLEYQKRDTLVVDTTPRRTKDEL